MKNYFLLMLVIVLEMDCNAQEIPLFTQKLTNSFLHNPANAGLNMGSASYSYRQNFVKVKDSPKTHLLSIHAPIRTGQYGLGANLYQENVNLISTMYLSCALARHMKFKNHRSLSFGISADYLNNSINRNLNFDGSDNTLEQLNAADINSLFLSAGALYSDRMAKIGFGVNRTNLTRSSDQLKVSPMGYSASVQLTFHTQGHRDRLEPFLFLRKFSSNATVEAGLYYIFNDLLTTGISLRALDAAILTMGFQLSPRTILGYSTEFYTVSFSNNLGGAHEIILRTDFAVQRKNGTTRIEKRRSLRKKIVSHSPEEFHRKNTRAIKRANRRFSVR